MTADDEAYATFFVVLSIILLFNNVFMMDIHESAAAYLCVYECAIAIWLKSLTAVVISDL